MDRPLLVVVTGPPATGKTTVARELAARLRLPLIAKDTIKESLFDSLGTGDLDWSRQLGEATYAAMVALAAESVSAGAGVVLEANFIRGDEPHDLAALPACFVQVHCSAPLEVVLERYASRERHSGHGDDERIEAVRQAVESGRHDPLDLPGETIRLDTSSDVDHDGLAARVRRAALWQNVSAAILAMPPGEAAFRGDDPPELASLLEKARQHAYRITDVDVEGLDPDVVIEATLGASLAVALADRARALEAIG